MTSRNFGSRVNHVQPGSPVSASNTSRATRQLEQRTNYLREILDAIEAGQLLARQDQTVSADVQVGHVVYWDSENKQFDLALAAAIHDVTTGAYVAAESANVIGICISKSATKTGTIALLGMAKLPPAVLEVMIYGEITAGRYYLSGLTPGRLVRQRPAVSVPVAYLHGQVDSCDEDSWVYINPQIKDFLEEHVHLQFPLAPFPAGDHVVPLSVDQCHTIINPDVALPGWLPADHASFNGKAPAGAVFGYNLAAHPELSRCWPPIPATSAVLELFQPIPDHVGDYHGYSRVRPDQVIIDANGIWWTNCCYGQVPWPRGFDSSDPEAYWDWMDNSTHIWMDSSQALWTAASSASNPSISSEIMAEADRCPTRYKTALILSFTKMTFATSKSVVTSLQPFTDEPIEFVNSDGTPANTGDLYARLKVSALVKDTLIRGGTALKTIDDSQLRFSAGWVAEGLVAGSDAVVLSGTHQEALNPANPVSGSNPLLHQGIVTVDVQLDPIEREINPQITKLGDALEREYKGIMYLGFPYNRDSGIRMKYNVPPGGLPTSPKMKLRALMFGRAVGPWAAMTMSYYRVTRPTAGSPFALVVGDTALTFDVVTPSDDYDGLGTDLPADRIIEVESNEFVVAAGDTVFITLSRASNATPLFQNDIGLVRIGGIIVT